MDDKRLEFVAMILAGEEIKYLAPDAIRKRVREASAAYDIMVEELTKKAPLPRECETCLFMDYEETAEGACKGCFGVPGHPHWRHP